MEGLIKMPTMQMVDGHQLEKGEALTLGEGIVALDSWLPERQGEIFMRYSSVIT